MCEAEGEQRLATIVDHIEPHRGDMEKFWDRSNWAPLCEPHHSGTKQAMEHHLSPTPTPRADRPQSILVSGPPGAGKRDYIDERLQSGDLIIDTDAIFAAISGEARHVQPANLLPFVRDVRDILLTRLARASNLNRAWILGVFASVDGRHQIARPLAAEVVILATPPSACMRRINADPLRRMHAAKWQQHIDRWWHDYEPHDGDRVVAPADRRASTKG
jgi:hypothetical protein